MAAFNKFEQFVTDLAAGSHVNCLNADTDALEIYLSNTAPSASLDSIKTDLAEISMTNAVWSPDAAGDTQNAATTTTGTITVVGTDLVCTATGGAVATFQYVVLFNETQTSPVDPLIGWWDYGSAVDLADGETFTVNFGASLFTVS